MFGAGNKQETVARVRRTRTAVDRRRSLRPSNQDDSEPIAAEGEAARVSVVTGPAGSGDRRS